MEKKSDLVDISYAAKRLGVSKLTLRKWDNSGKLKAIRLGARGDRKYRVTDLERFVNQEQASVGTIAPNAFEKWFSSNECWVEQIAGLPLCMELAIRKEVEINDWFEPGLQFSALLFENDYAFCALSVPESIRNCQAQMNALIHQPQRIEAFFAEWKKRTDNLTHVIVRAEFLELEKLSQADLLAEFDSFNKKLAEFWSVGMVLEPYSPFIDRIFFHEFKKEVADSKLAHEAFGLLTQPLKPSFVSEQRISLLKLAVKHLSSPSERKRVLGLPVPDFLAELRTSNASFFFDLLKHQQDFFWVQNSYADWTVLSLHDFAGFLRESVANANISDLKREIEKLEHPTELESKQKALFSKLSLSDSMTKKVLFIREISWLRDERKRMALRMLNPLYRFIFEFGRRTGIDPKLVAYAGLEEIPLLLENRLPVETLHKRRHRFFWVWQTKNKKSVLTANEAMELKQRVFSRLQNKDSQTLHGLVACRGPDAVVSGKARVILNPKNQSVQSGEILVTSMTRPDFVSLAKNARAIVTNEGGITCHAAIVSRELNKPCIIGTQTATQLIANGDELELRMNHGIVTIKKTGK